MFGHVRSYGSGLAILATVGFSLSSLVFGTTIKTNICQLPALVNITSPANKATVKANTVTSITGQATAGSIVTISEDGKQLAMLTASQSNAYTTQAVFTAASHQLTIVASNNCGQKTGTAVSITGKVTAGTTPPPAAVSGTLKLTLANGASATTTQNSAYVSGKTSANSSVQLTINGVVVGNGYILGTTFGLSVPLAVGKNTIITTATSGTNHASQTITVTRSGNAAYLRPGGLPWYRTTSDLVIVVVSLLALVPLIKLLVFK